MTSSKVSTLDQGPRQGGGGGRLPQFSERVSGMYSIGLYSERAYLDVAVLVKLTRSCGTTADHTMQRPHSLPPLAKGGGGAEVGPHMLIYSSEDQGLYVEGHRLLVVGDENVIFLREPEEQGMLQLVGRDNVEGELGILDPKDFGPVKFIRFVQILNERLKQLVSVRAFVQSGD